MTTSLPAPNTSQPAQPASITIASPGEEGVRSALPDTSVTEDTIEDAYVNFILFCNPAVPSTTDTAPLRTAFRALPKSNRETFRPFVLFELIKQLENKENKELKTWTDLAVKLGVTHPDPEKGESSQKIQQYAVRLKVCTPAPALLGQAVANNDSAGCMRCTLTPSSTISWGAKIRTGHRYRTTWTRSAKAAVTG